MAFDQNEWEQRKQRRKEDKEKRDKAQKRFRIRLIIAGVALAAVLILILVLSLMARSNEKPPEQTTGATEGTTLVSDPTDGTEPSSTGATQTTAPKGAEDVTVVRFAAAGDVNVTDKVVASGGVTLDYSPVFQDVVSILADADLTAVNFEGNLIGAPYGSERVSAPPQLLTALRNAGVDMVQLANSRTIANGVSGLVTTLQSVRATGLEPLGVYASNQEYANSGGYTLWEVKGVRIAVVAFTKGMDSMALPVGSEDCVNLLYEDYSSKYAKVNRERITDVIKAAAAEKPDVIIAMLHWGSEYNDTHAESQTDIANLLFSLGVDAIIGTHPHYVQEMKFDAEKGTFLAYSLGDLVGDGEKAGTEYAVVLELDITKNNKTGTAKITGYRYTPIFIYENDNGFMRVVRMGPAMTAYENNFPSKVSDEIYSDMVYAAKRIEERIHPKTNEKK